MLKIKDVQAYRTYYKEQVRRIKDDRRDEHMLSPYQKDPETGEETFGWFEIYYGDADGFGNPKAGISNKLLSFLDMAKDGQAVYEFLQNAVDAKGCHFTMIWGRDEVNGKEYLLAANNGKMFTTDNVRSILNIGGSDKGGNAQSIGKFGIGFKLAHRLVGKDNGLHELLTNYSGPVLFSWRQNEVAQLAQSGSVEPVESDFSKNGSTENNPPWLFKILLTCFPCLPENERVEEFPKLIGGETAEAPLFPDAELKVLSRWTQKLLDKVGETSYQEGSLFFMELGEGKAEELKDHNLNEGVKFSMGILQKTAGGRITENTGLSTVQLNGETPITLPDLEYEAFRVSSNEEDYQKVFDQHRSNDGRKHEEIEFLLGFRPYHQIADYFKGAPNFYLYFPLSEEVHQFNFILHCNAFDNSASRTFLQPGKAGRNNRLFGVMILQIERRLKALSESNPRRFLDLYAALLTSGESGSENRNWVVEAFVKPLNSLLKTMIPARRSFEYEDFERGESSVYIKSTEIDINATDWGLEHLLWFYWDEKTYPEFSLKAMEKLSLFTYTIVNLLKERGAVQNTNAWLNNKADRIELLLNELHQHWPSRTDKELIQNLLELQILEFSDGSVCSFNELSEKQNDGYLVLHNSLGSIQELLVKIGFKTTVKNFNDYQFIYPIQNFLKTDSQMRGHTELVKLFSQTLTEEAALQLSPSEKLRVYEAFRKLSKKNRTERMAELKLFRNQTGALVYLKNLLKESAWPWLQPYTLHTEEAHLDLDYRVTQSEEIYAKIIHPFWPDIADRIVQNSETAPQALDELIKLFAQSEHQPALEEQRIFFKGNAEKQPHIFFYKDLLNNERYTEWQELLYRYFKVVMPDEWSVPYLDQEPFIRTSEALEFKLAEKKSLSKDDLWSLLELAAQVDVDFFKHLVITEQDGAFELAPIEALRNCYTQNELLKGYIQNYHQGHWLPLSEVFHEAPQRPKDSGTRLMQWLIENVGNEDTERLALTQALLQESQESQFTWFQKLPSILLDTNWEDKDSNTTYLKMLSHLCDHLPKDQQKELPNKLKLKHSDGLTALAHIQQANDKIKVAKGDKEYTLSLSKLLNTDNQESMQIIHDFAQETIKQELLTEQDADILFKRSISEEPDLNIFHEGLDDFKLQNAHQLAFVLLSGQVERKDLSKYQVLAADEQWNDLKSLLFLNETDDTSFLKPVYVLNQQYDGLRDILKINDPEPFAYGPNPGDLILSKFLFMAGCAPSVFRNNLETEALLNYLLLCWKNTPVLTKTTMSQEGWQPIVHFNPASSVLHPYRLASENLPPEIENWCNGEPEREGFLSALGVQSPTSELIALRKFLLEVEPHFDEERLYSMSLLQLENTLQGLAKGFSAEVSATELYFEAGDSRLPLIHKMMAKLAKNNQPDFPVLVYRSGGKQTLVDPMETPICTMDTELMDDLQANDHSLDDLFESSHILAIPKDLEDEMGSYPPLAIDRDFKPIQAKEHTEVVYEKWKEQHRIRLYKSERLTFDIEANIEGRVRHLGNIEGESWYKASTDDGFTEFYYLGQQGVRMLHDSLKKKEDPYAEALKEFIHENDKMVEFVSNEIRNGSEEWNEQIKKSERQKDREQQLKTLKDAIPYSHQWFIAYLGYLDTFSEAEDTIQQKSLVFQLAEKYEFEGKTSFKHFYLRGAGQLIPESIEHFEDITVKLRYRNKKSEDLHLEGVTKRGQDLLVYSPKELPHGFFTDLPNVERATIHFTPVLDLLRRLKNAFSNQNDIIPWNEISTALPNIEFIYGPPGTGKTTKLASKVIRTIKKDPEKRVLILTPTNKAADVLVKKLLVPDERQVEVLAEQEVCRLSSAPDPELETEFKDLYQSSIDTHLLARTNVLAATIHRLPYFQAIQDDSSRKLLQLTNHWDYVILDEASMIDLPYMVFALKALQKTNPNAHFIIAGDPKQLPPVQPANDTDLESMEIVDENIYKMLQIESFDRVEQDAIFSACDHTIDNLDRQYRSIPPIGELFNHFSYHGLLTHERELKSIRPLPKDFQKLALQPLSFIHFPLNKERSIFAPQKLVYSSYHLYAALLATEMVMHFDKCAEREAEYRWKIGLISPYKAHALLLGKLLSSNGLSKYTEVICGTVHGFQGDQCDIVLFTATPNNLKFTDHPKSLLSKEYLYNVAISRAQDYLWILHPDYEGTENRILNRLINIHEEQLGKIDRHSADLIEHQLFKKPDFLAEHTYFSGHDPVNLFGETEQAYFVKANDRAIDIQLRKMNRWTL